MAQVDAVLARCSAAHREELEQTSSAAVAASQETARKHERSQRVAIARCLRRLGHSVDTATEAVELVAVAPTSVEYLVRYSTSGNSDFVNFGF